MGCVWWWSRFVGIGGPRQLYQLVVVDGKLTVVVVGVVVVDEVVVEIESHWGSAHSGGIVWGGHCGTRGCGVVGASVRVLWAAAERGSAGAAAVGVAQCSEHGSSYCEA